jgi:hypothetical protein
MRYDIAKAILSEAIEQLDEGRKTWYQRSASLIGRMGGSPEEVRQGITGKRTPAAKSGRALLTKAQKAAEKKERDGDPDYPYGKAESRRMSKYMSEAREILSEARMKYGQDAIPAVERLYMLTYSPGEKNEKEGGNRKFVGKMKKNPSMVYEGAYKGAMEDWLTDLPKPAIAELKAKHGKELAHTGGAGYRDIATKKTLPLHKSIVGILKKHKVKPFAQNIHDSSHVIQMSFHTYHGDMNEEKQEGGNESKESTKSMIARLVARRHQKSGVKVPSNVKKDVDPKYKTKDDMYEAAPDIGQNLKGMPKRAGRKLAYASKRWGKGEIPYSKYKVADERHTRKMGGNARRWGKKLDKALSDFSARTGIKLKDR